LQRGSILYFEFKNFSFIIDQQRTNVYFYLMANNNWYRINNEEQFDSPTLIFYPDRITANIELAKAIIEDVNRLRPHVKTHKTKEIVLELMDAGITKFKCSTIAEAEMLAMCKASDILLAYQPTLAKLLRLIKLVKVYPKSNFSCLVDNKSTARLLAAQAQKEQIVIDVYIDLNVGMNRTGIVPGDAAIELFEYIDQIPALKMVGLHAYDGHINHKDLIKRKQECDEAFATVEDMRKNLRIKGFNDPLLIVCGSPTFGIHAQRANTECSPGTFILWDKNYSDFIPELAFNPAALILTRVVSIPAENKLSIDLGHKAIASEGELHKRVFFLNAPELRVISHSEEHIVVEALPGHHYKVGDVLYALPFHICPTVALYSHAACVKNGEFLSYWEIIARNRKIMF
jgi:D-serine deaminase-like pyridoxal phosphate-dependent protein